MQLHGRSIRNAAGFCPLSTVAIEEGARHQKYLSLQLVGQKKTV